jgi:pyruvate dehydrogenase E1 component
MSTNTAIAGENHNVGSSESETARTARFELLEALQRKVLWLASWMVHNANHLRDNPDGLKVGGHQASSASAATLMTALYFHALRPGDRVAVKPHASPTYHAIQYLLGLQSRENIEQFRAFGGAQSYPSRTKDYPDVDFSTGSVGLGVAETLFASLTQDYLESKGWKLSCGANNRMIALVGDAELDEGNIFEAMMEGWKHRVRNVWWVVDYNRQSLDSVINDRIFGRINALFEAMDWRVVTLKYGQQLESAFREPDGDRLRDWIDACPNSLYSALVFKGGSAWREHLSQDLADFAGIRELLDRHDDDSLHQLMTNLAGHDMMTVVDAFESIDDDTPTCFIAYTIKGFGLPLAGHKDNHSGLMSPGEMAILREAHHVPTGQEWEPFAGLEDKVDALREFLDSVPFASGGARRYRAAQVSVPRELPVPTGEAMSTQECFGRLLAAAARDRGDFGSRIVTTSPDVTVSTNLGGWVNRRGVYSRDAQVDVFQEEHVASFQQWSQSPKGQHIELGIAENNLFLLLGALGLSHSLFGQRLLPVGTLYDPFIQRGLDALNYACYQDARFILTATPSGVSLAPEGGAHQSIATPMIGMAQDRLASFEPAFADELAVILQWAFEYIQRESDRAHDPRSGDLLGDGRGGSVYLRLSTRRFDQPERVMTDDLRVDVIQGGYWLHHPGRSARLAIAYTGAVCPEVLQAHRAILADFPECGLLAITSADRLTLGWRAASRARRQGAPSARSHIEKLLAPLAPDARIVSVIDGYPDSLSWLGSVYGHRVFPLGVEHFGQSGTVRELYEHHELNADAIIEACAGALVD